MTFKTSIFSKRADITCLLTYVILVLLSVKHTFYCDHSTMNFETCQPHCSLHLLFYYPNGRKMVKMFKGIFIFSHNMTTFDSRGNRKNKRNYDSKRHLIQENFWKVPLASYVDSLYLFAHWCVWFRYLKVLKLSIHLSIYFGFC